MTQISLDKTGKAHYNVKAVSGCSADGSALGSGPRGPEFKSPHSDQRKVERYCFFNIFRLFVFCRSIWRKIFPIANLVAYQSA